MKKKLLFLLAIILMFSLSCSSTKLAKGTETDKPLSDDSIGNETKDTEKAPVSSPGDKKYSADKITDTTGAVPPLSSPKKKNGKKDAPMVKEETKIKSSPSREKSADRKPAGALSASGLKAGFADDNRQFNFFIKFLEQFKDKVNHYSINIDERIILKVSDADNKCVANAKVEIFNDKKPLCSGKTYSDGSFLFFPGEFDKKISTYRAVITFQQKSKEIAIDRQGKREVAIKLDVNRPEMKNIPIDILFIMDTTGSMGEEISRLKNTIEIINMNIASISTKPKVRFGMVLYRDREDEYITKIIPLTGDLEKFRNELEKIDANGGGDEAEDLQSALSDTINKIKWNTNGIRLSFIITDAPAHIDYNQKYTYVDAVHDARKDGIKIFAVGTGGLNITGEYILRQIAQYTYSKYIFLTYGEKGESEGGKEGSVSHHTGSNFQTDKLESIIIRFAKEELGYQSDKPIEQGEDYIQAVKISDEKNEETLKKLNEMCITQLIDYATIGIETGTTVSIIPFAPAENLLKSNAEYFTEQMSFSLIRNKVFKVVERKDIQKILKELELQYTGLVHEESAVKAGKLIGAKMIITGKLYIKNDNYELFLKLLRVETGEVLSVNKLKIDKKLGLAK